ncbi:MAG: DUF3253 domain-containing protein [Rhodospirillales bacterium]|nr:DUF3253 domain-containing protein [Rhodospirillales bacterium]MDE2197694.1 DUF3253 domain-containing protein [Rhodospirillales bacterium]MDE2576069.1 DUF3253 domain-containing protein [Rhodospirillales bacterium]
MSEHSQTEAEILRLAAAAGAGRSISPTEVARALAPGPGDAWRSRLTAIRRAAIRLAEAGQIDILRKGKPVAAADARGVIRLRLRGAEDG